MNDEVYRKVIARVNRQIEPYELVWDGSLSPYSYAVKKGAVHYTLLMPMLMDDEKYYKHDLLLEEVKKVISYYEQEDDDPVNNPPHYTAHPSGVECIEITRHMNFNIGNAIKYLWRHGKKNQEKTIEDLEKAAFYIEDEIKRLKNLSQVEDLEDPFLLKN